MKRWRAITRFNRQCSGTPCAGGWLRQRITALFFLAALSGCAAQQRIEPLVNNTSVFNVYAQVTIRQPQARAQRFFVIWRRNDYAGGIRDEMEIKNTLGVTQAQLMITPQQAEIKYPGNTIQETDGSALAKRLFGYALPLEAIGYWINGQADPNATAEQKKQPDGKIKEINQYDWKIIYLSSDSNQQPKKLKMITAENIQVDINIQRRLSE